MSTPALPDESRDDLIARYRLGPLEVIDYIDTFPDARTRRDLYTLAQRTFGEASFIGRDLDSLIVIAQAGIEEGLKQSAAESDADLSDTCKNFSNVLSYNLAADLAECWPEDDMPRAARHFETGLCAALDCLRWRKELRKGPYPFSIAWWARGIHELSLGRFGDAADSFDKALDFAIQAASPVGSRPNVETDFNVILNRGYGGLARRLSGIPDGESQYQNACARFSQIAATSDGETRGEARFGLQQLECAGNRIGSDRVSGPVAAVAANSFRAEG